MRGKDGRLFFAAHNPKVEGSNPSPQPSGRLRTRSTSVLLTCTCAQILTTSLRQLSPPGPAFLGTSWEQILKIRSATPRWTNVFSLFFRLPMRLLLCVGFASNDSEIKNVDQELESPRL
jgi:hypothetical protein